jgi:hypothetical protein
MYDIASKLLIRPKESLAQILQQVDDVILRMGNNLVVIVWNKLDTYDVGIKSNQLANT